MSEHRDPNCPETILAAIPWYPEGLTPEECGVVEAHAADCRACRAELAFLRGDEEPAIEIPDSEDVYARVLERIGRSDDPEGVDAPAQSVSFLRHLSQRAAGPVSVAAGLMVALLSGMLTSGVIWAVRVAPAYETASAASTPVSAAGGQYLQVVFQEDATANEINDRLRSVQGTVVSGPSQQGVYRVRLATGVDRAAALETLRDDQRGVVAFAEPSRG